LPWLFPRMLMALGQLHREGALVEELVQVG
jgi:hypothetical protein